MRKQFLKISFSKLRKQEVQTLVSRVISVVSEHDPETLQIKKIYDLLVELEPQIDSLKLKPIAHPISKELDELRQERLAIAQVIIYQVAYIKRGKVKGMEESIKLASPIIIQHLKGFWRYSDIKIYQNINSLFELIKTDVELQTAIKTLGLIPYLDDLKRVNYSIERSFNARAKSIAARPKALTPRVTASAKTALKDLFNQIDIAQVKNKELDYTSLIDELNKQIATMKATLKARASYNKRRAEQESLNNDNVDETNSEVVVETETEANFESTSPDETMETMQMENSTNGEVDNEEVLGQLDKKKTVAVSTKQTRLPDISNEA